MSQIKNQMIAVRAIMEPLVVEGLYLWRRFYTSAVFPLETVLSWLIAMSKILRDLVKEQSEQREKEELQRFREAAEAREEQEKEEDETEGHRGGQAVQEDATEGGKRRGVPRWRRSPGGATSRPPGALNWRSWSRRSPRQKSETKLKRCVRHKTLAPHKTR